MTEFGLALRHHWTLDPAVAFLNHGSYGATPKPVLAAQQRWRALIEAEPVDFFSRRLPGFLRAAAARLGSYLGVPGEDVVFVDNATAGANAVLQSITLKPGDRVMIHAQTYGAVRNAVLHWAGRAGAEVDVVPVPFPWRGEDLVAPFRAALTDRTRLVILDHITSPTAMIYPVAEIIAAIAPVPVLVDGAHAPGQIDLDLGRLGATWYTGNAHKWLCAPKGAAFLWAAPAAQAMLHPTIISHGWSKGFRAEFDWTGTRDPSAALCVPDCLDFRDQIGGDAAIKAGSRDLAREAAAMLAAAWNTETGGPEEGFAAMRMVRLPVSGTFVQADAIAFRDRLFAEHRVEIPVNALAGGLWCRLSAAPYNAPADYERLAMAVRALA